jgi:hypothetical protein
MTNLLGCGTVTACLSSSSDVSLQAYLTPFRLPYPGLQFFLRELPVMILRGIDPLVKLRVQLLDQSEFFLEHLLYGRTLLEHLELTLLTVVLVSVEAFPRVVLNRSAYIHYLTPTVLTDIDSACLVLGHIHLLV